MLMFTVFAVPFVIFGVAAESPMFWWLESESEMPPGENAVEDHHVYYNSTRVTNSDVVMKEWVHLDATESAKVSNMLLDSHRGASKIQLLFKFPFYGHVLQYVTIATGGFLFMGEFMHAWLTASQYIAPLMANFDTRISHESLVRHFDNGTALTVQWEKVKLNDRPEAGEFTFQVTLHQSGDIVFAYLYIPLKIEDIDDEGHPVKIGLSDAYVVDTNTYFQGKKKIYEYHRVLFNKTDIHTSTVIYLKALPTCNALKDCASCTTTKIGFQCSWCESEERCSDGVDRKRQDWLFKKCHLINSTEVSQCPVQALTTSTTTFKPPQPSTTASSIESSTEQCVETGDHRTLAYCIATSLVCLVLVLAGWAIYAYSTPDSPSGRFFYRTKTSTLGRYSAASTVAFAGESSES